MHARRGVYTCVRNFVGEGGDLYGERVGVVLPIARGAEGMGREN